jgi:hypothetical protein
MNSLFSGAGFSLRSLRRSCRPYPELSAVLLSATRKEAISLQRDIVTIAV